MAPPPMNEKGRKKQTLGSNASFEDLSQYFIEMRGRVCDVPISIDFNTWRVNLSLLSMQSIMLYGTNFNEYRFSLFIFTSVWTGRSFFHAEFMKKFSQRGSHLHNHPKGILLRSYGVSMFMMLSSFTMLVYATKDYSKLVHFILFPCMIGLFLEIFRSQAKFSTPIQFLFALEQAYFVGVVSLKFELNPLLMYDSLAVYTVIWTAFFNNIMAAIAKYFILHFTRHQIHAHQLFGWKSIPSTNDTEPWKTGVSYPLGSIVQHKGYTWEAIGIGNEAEPSSLTSRCYIWIWLNPFRLITVLMTLQVIQVVVIAIFSFCCDSIIIMGAMMFVSADYLQLMHSIRFALLGRSFRNVLLRPQNVAQHALVQKSHGKI